MPIPLRLVQTLHQMLVICEAPLPVPLPHPHPHPALPVHPPQRRHHPLRLPRLPQIREKLLARIEIHLAPSGLAEQVLMHEPTGDLTHITFTDMTAN